MLWKVIFLSFVLNVLAKEYRSSEQHFKITHKGKAYPAKLPKIESKDEDSHYGSLSHIGFMKPEHHEEYAWRYPSYEFSYDVYDPHTHDIKGQTESRDGDVVKGEYWLLQPDGRKRTVKYHADKHSGFHADVQYSDDKHNYEYKKEEGVEEVSRREHEEEESYVHQEDVYNNESQEAEAKSEGKGMEGWRNEKEGHESEDEDSSEKKKEENEDASDGKQDEYSSEKKEKGGDGEESRGQEELGKWIHNRHWGYRNEKKKYDLHDSLWERKHKAGHINSYRYPMYQEYHDEEIRYQPVIIRENYGHPSLYKLHKRSRE